MLVWMRDGGKGREGDEEEEESRKERGMEEASSDFFPEQERGKVRRESGLGEMGEMGEMSHEKKGRTFTKGV